MAESAKLRIFGYGSSTPARVRLRNVHGSPISLSRIEESGFSRGRSTNLGLTEINS